MRERVKEILRETIGVHEGLIAQAPRIEQAAQRLADTFAAGGSLYVMGNGGSAADSQHFAGEMVGRFLMDRRPLPCHALSTDTSILTAIANDYGVQEIFAKQVAAFVRQGDAVVGISTSGNSADVNAAIDEAKRRGAFTIGLTGGSGGELARRCDLTIIAPSAQTPRIQEAHATIIHVICELVEQALFGSRKSD